MRVQGLYYLYLVGKELVKSEFKALLANEQRFQKMVILMNMSGFHVTWLCRNTRWSADSVVAIITHISSMRSFKSQH